jgi:hypothetical protein
MAGQLRPEYAMIRKKGSKEVKKGEEKSPSSYEDSSPLPFFRRRGALLLGHPLTQQVVTSVSRQAIAQLKGITETEVAEAVEENTRRLYGGVFS